MTNLRGMGIYDGGPSAPSQSPADNVPSTPVSSSSSSSSSPSANPLTMTGGKKRPGAGARRKAGMSKPSFSQSGKVPSYGVKESSKPPVQKSPMKRNPFTSKR